jgi:hypothetical protein
MTRITSTILIFMLLLNGATTVMTASGLSEDIGVTLAPGVNDAMNTVIDEMEDGFSPDVGVIESLISMLTAGLNLFRVVVEGLYAAPAMFMNLGFPAWMVTTLFAPLYLISTLELMFIATGRDMI